MPVPGSFYYKIPLFLSYTASTLYSDKYGWGKESWGGSPWGYGWYLFDYGNLVSITHQTDSRINTYKELSLKYGKLFLFSDSMNEKVYFKRNDDPAATYTKYDWLSGLTLNQKTTSVSFYLNYPEIFGVDYSLFKVYEITQDPLPYYNPTMSIHEKVKKKGAYVSSKNVNILVETDPRYRLCGDFTTHALLAAYELSEILNLNIFPRKLSVPRTWRIKDLNLIGRDILNLKNPKYDLLYRKTNDLRSVVRAYLLDMFGL